MLPFRVIQPLKFTQNTLREGPRFSFTLSIVCEGSKFTFIHPFSIQRLTNCSSSNSFDFKSMHFDGGVYPRVLPSAARNLLRFLDTVHPFCFQAIAHSFVIFCTPPKSNSFILMRLRTL